MYCEGALKIPRAHQFVTGWWMMFGKIIGRVQFSGSPIKMELFLGNAILEPVVTHVKGFGFFQTHVCMQNTV
jgi:hypothetical protein